MWIVEQHPRKSSRLYPTALTARNKMGAEQSTSKDGSSGGKNENVVHHEDSRDSVVDPIEREQSRREYDNAIWLQDELTKERRLHRGISENIILEDFRRGRPSCMSRRPRNLFTHCIY